MKQTKRFLILIALITALVLVSCGGEEALPEAPESEISASCEEAVPGISEEEEPPEPELLPQSSSQQEMTPEPESSAAEIPADRPVPVSAPEGFSLEQVPEYAGRPYVRMNGGVPYFETEGLAPVSDKNFSPLDDLGRCGTVSACIGPDLMPTEEREGIGMIKPTGWHLAKYDHVDGKYLYNRCHLIGYQLCGENANELNLITGTRCMNVEGMLPFENMTADYVESTRNHVAYRVTPVFDGDDLLARGVLMEGYSIEDQGTGVAFCCFVYNVQPYVKIDYATGDNCSSGTPPAPESDAAAPEADHAVRPAPAPQPESGSPQSQQTQEPVIDYVLNNNTMKFHFPDCRGAKAIKDCNREEFTGTRQELIDRGYSPCGICHP